MVIKVNDAYYFCYAAGVSYIDERAKKFNRNQRYDINNIILVYRSFDPLIFGLMNEKDFFVTILSIAAPELVYKNGLWYNIWSQNGFEWNPYGLYRIRI